jgi:AcrR family transcriptional regulator
MNKAGQARKPRRRTYDNSLREEQARQTRERILEGVVELLAAPRDGESLTMADVARRVGVSEPTLYRHFGSRERLYEAIDAYTQARLGLPPMPTRADQLPGQIGTLFRTLHQKGHLVRAAVRAGIGQEVRERGKSRRFKELRAVLADDTAHLPPGEALAVAALHRLIAGFDGYRVLVDELGVGPEEAADAAAWAIAAFRAQLGRDRTARRTRLASDGTTKERSR